MLIKLPVCVPEDIDMLKESGKKNYRACSANVEKAIIGDSSPNKTVIVEDAYVNPEHIVSINPGENDDVCKVSVVNNRFLVPLPIKNVVEMVE
mgnify:CR=1 FL=1